MAYEWTPDLATGMNDIDAQHRELLRRIGELHRCMRAGETSSVPGVLVGIREYVQTHFANEEREMREVGFPSAARHAAQHARFTTELARFEKDWSRHGTTASLTIDLAGWLSSWFRDHVRGYDAEFATFLRARRSAAG